MDYLKGKMIRLRALDPDDTDFMSRVEADVCNFEYSGLTAPYSSRQLLEYAVCYDADPFRATQLRLVIEDITDSNPVGLLDFTEISARERTAFTGIYILPAWRRRGLALDSLLTARRYAADILALRYLGAKISTANDSSLALFRKAGWIQYGVMPEWIYSPALRLYVDLHLLACRL